MLRKNIFCSFGCFWCHWIWKLDLSILNQSLSPNILVSPLFQMTKSGLPQVLLLSRSPLLQGAALAAMLDLFRALVAAGAADPSTGLTAQALNESLAAPVVDANTGAQVHKQVCYSY